MDNIPNAKFSYPDLLHGVPSIRLIRFEESDPDNGFLAFSMKVYAMTNLPEYDALSYTWDNPFPLVNDHESDGTWTNSKHSIRCRGRNFHVRRNLRDALIAISSRGWMRRHIWIDAICINQLDFAERGDQVSHMSAIYSRAKHVIVWLGPSDASSETIYAFMNNFGKAIIDLADEEGWDAVNGYDPLTIKLYQKLGQNVPDNTTWRAWTQFFRRSYFSRTWILQEVSLADRTTVLCGKHYFNLNDLIQLSDYVARAPWRPIRGRIYDEGRLPEDVLSSIEWTRHLVAHNGFGSTCCGPSHKKRYGVLNQAAIFLHLLGVSRGSQAFNPSDQIFGGLGVLKHVRGSSYDEKVIIVDYYATTVDVHRSVTRHFLEMMPWLSILSNVEDATDRKLDGLPSWVPDFSVTYDSEAGRTRLGNRLNATYTVPMYQASLRHTAIPLRRHFKGDLLYLQGYCLDSVTEVSAYHPRKYSAPEVRSQLQICLSLPPLYFNGQTRLEAYWRTTLGDSFAESPKPLLEESFLAYEIGAALVYRPPDEPPMPVWKKEAKDTLQIIN